MNGTYANNNTAANNETRSNSGANQTQLMGCRIAGPGNYIPAHRQNNNPDKINQAQCKFTVFQNIRGKRMRFDITAWGKWADTIAKYGATGKEITIFGELNSYRGRVWMQTPDGTPRQCYTHPDGSPVYVDKIGITLKNGHFGPDSDKTVQEEIRAGIRPQGWDNSATPGKQQWREICATRKQMQYQPGMERFGYARVSLPNNGQVVAGGNVATQANGGGYGGNTGQANMQPNAGGNNQGGGYTAPNTGGGYNPAPNGNGGGYGGGQTGGYQPNQPVAPGNGNQPVEVNGQHMGYAMPNGQGGNQGGNGGYQPNNQPAGYAAPNNGGGVNM